MSKESTWRFSDLSWTIIRSINPFALLLFTNSPSYFPFWKLCPVIRLRPVFMLILYTYTTHRHQAQRGNSYQCAKGECPVSSKGGVNGRPRVLSICSLKVGILSGLDGDVFCWVYLLTELHVPWTLPHIWPLKILLGIGFRASQELSLESHHFLIEWGSPNNPGALGAVHRSCTQKGRM